MEAVQWFEIMKEAIKQTEIELEAPQIDLMLLIHLEEELKAFPEYSQEKNYVSSALLGQAWSILTQILTNELQLDVWNSITIKGRKKAFTLYSLGFNLVIIIYYEAVIDPLDILKTLMKYIFIIGYKDNYDTVGLIASEGYPIWVTFPDGKEVDEFLFAISITSLLTLVERIDMEVSAGGVNNCIIQGSEDLLLNVSFNPSQDLALAVTQKTTSLSDILLKKELNSIYQKLVDPIIYSAVVPEIMDEDREKMLKQILEDVTGEATEEEIQTLNIFDSMMLQALENEIKMVQKRYGANEISIGYLRKRMRLPSEVLSMSLEYLISNENLKGKIGKAKQTGQEILVLEPWIERSQEYEDQIKVIKTQIKDLFIPLKPFLRKLPKLERPVVTQEVITEALSEFQVMLTLSDTDSIFLLANDIRFNGTQIETAVKTEKMLQTQINETDKEDIILNELQKRLKVTEERIKDLNQTIIGQAIKFHNDLLNSYRLFLRLLPIPTEFKEESENQKLFTIIKCNEHNCETKIKIKDNIDIWVKISYFATILGFRDDYPEDYSQLIKELLRKIEDQYQQLVSLMKYSQKEFKKDYLPFIENLEELLISNNQRDEIINSLKQSKITTEKKDFFSLFNQCSSCHNWYCEKHLSSSSNKCKYC